MQTEVSTCMLPKLLMVEGEVGDVKGSGAGWGQELGEHRGTFFLRCPVQNSKKPENSKFEPGLLDL